MTRLKGFFWAAATVILFLMAPIGVSAQENEETQPANEAIFPTMGVNSFKEIQPLQAQPTIVGIATLDDGSPAPMGTVIVSDCGGKSTKEATADLSGGFKFQLGADNDPLADTGSSNYAGLADASQSMSSASPTFPDESLMKSVRPVGCEVRAQLEGYRSTSVTLPPFQGMEILEIGSLVIYPASKILGSTVSVTDQAAPKDARKAFERAEKAYQQDNLDEAQKYLQIALKEYSRFASAWFRMGQIHVEFYRVKEARDAFSKAMEADAKFVSPLVELGRLEAGESGWPRAVELTERALELNPFEFPDAYYIHALACMHLKRTDDAERSARKLVPLDPQHRWPEVHMILADILHERQDLSGEAAELQTYLKYAPESFTRDEAISRLRDLEPEKPQP